MSTPDAPTRRTVLKILGAGAALATSACAREPIEKVLPYVRRPPELTPGNPTWYATSLVLDGFATGVLVETHAGRPTKIEGNPAHPASLGATSAREQAAIFGLYDAARARAVLDRGAFAPTEALEQRLAAARDDGGERLRLVLEPTGSPLVASLATRILERFPRARFSFHSPARPAHSVDGAEIALGRRVETIHDLSRARVVLALDADFMGAMPLSLRYARQLVDNRRVPTPGAPMSRLYVVEPAFTPTGALADHRLPRAVGEVGRLAAALAAELVHLGATADGIPDEALRALSSMRAHADAGWIGALARDLRRAGRDAAVLVGDRQPRETHALAHLIRALLGATTSRTISPVLVEEALPRHSLPALAGEIHAGAVDTLVLLQSNVAYSAPGDLDMPALLRRVPDTVYLGEHVDETAGLARWFVPAAHELESWADARAFDGTVSIVQPLLAPLFGGRTVAELLALVAGEPRASSHRLVRQRFLGTDGAPGEAPPPHLEALWRDVVAAGLLAGSEASAVRAPISGAGALATVEAIAKQMPPSSDAIEIAFAPDPSIHDGRFANDARLQEVPRPHTKLTWGNAALVPPSLAASLGLRTGDVVRVETAGRALDAPVLVARGHAERSVTLHLGFGRTRLLPIGGGLGFSAYPLRPSASPGFAPGAVVTRTGRTTALAIAQRHMTQELRPQARRVSARAYAQDPRSIAPERGRPLLSLLPMAPSSRPAPATNQWAMSIDLGACIGCNACVVACQAENNVPVVGAEAIRSDRAMHWLRIDTYYEGEAGDARVVHQPMLCQHCERAPCEYPCPTNATVHSPDGLNEMIYNRCIGTRACANNCPYKVRRFNWFDWGEKLETENAGLVELANNPDVTVRERGVMEKCTFCVQRIRRAEIEARAAGGALAPDAIQTACQQACPTRAFHFGSLEDESGEVTLERAQERSYSVLHELGTLPRTTYLARIDNPNEELDEP